LIMGDNESDARVKAEEENRADHAAAAEFVKAVDTHKTALEATRADARAKMAGESKVPMLVDSYKLNSRQALYVRAGHPVPELPKGTDDYMLRNGPTLEGLEIKPQALLPKGDYYIGLWPDDIIEQIERQGYVIQTATPR
jgi:hypothetical protein